MFYIRKKKYNRAKHKKLTKSFRQFIQNKKGYLQIKKKNRDKGRKREKGDREKGRRF